MQSLRERSTYCLQPQSFGAGVRVQGRLPQGTPSALHPKRRASAQVAQGTQMRPFKQRHSRVPTRNWLQTLYSEGYGEDQSGVKPLVESDQRAECGPHSRNLTQAEKRCSCARWAVLGVDICCDTRSSHTGNVTEAETKRSCDRWV